MTNTPPAGWYNDPNDASRQRWWDGTAWTDQPPPPSSPPPSAAPAQVPERFRRKWKTWHLLLIGFLALMFGVAVGQSSDSKNGSGRTAAPSPTGSPGTAAGGTTSPTSRQWVAVAELNGADDTQGPNFTLSGAEARLRYTSEQDFLWVVYVAKPGQDLNRVGGTPLVSCSDPCSSTTRLDRRVDRDRGGAALMAGCRDCRMCVESLASGRRMTRSVVALGSAGATVVARKMFTRTCPTCGHRINVHGRDKAGRFKD